MKAMLEPVKRLKEMELAFDFTSRMAYTEELKRFPYADVWELFLLQKSSSSWFGLARRSQEYQKVVLGLRK